MAYSDFMNPLFEFLSCIGRAFRYGDTGSPRVSYCISHYFPKFLDNITLIAVIIFLLFLGYTHFRVYGLRRTFVQAIGILFGLSLLVLALRFFLPDRIEPDWLISSEIMNLFVVSLIIIYLPRLYFGVRSRRYNSADYDDPEFQPLASQWQAIDDLIEKCGGASEPERDTLERTPYEGKIVTINAGWGTGKTFIVRSFEQLSNARLNTQRSTHTSRPVNLVVSYYNAWSNQMEPDPEYAIVRHLISDRRVMWPYGWITIPAWRILATGVMSHFRWGSRYKLQVFSVGVEAPAGLEPPRINWTVALARLAWCTWKLSPEGRRRAPLVLEPDSKLHQILQYLASLRVVRRM